MNRSGKRKVATAFDALDIPLVSVKRPLLHSSAHFTKFSMKLRTLLDQERYPEAKLLFTEMVKSSRYDFKNLWQAGIEVIGRSSPHELVGYLKAVFISSPPKLSAQTFNVYIDQLIIEEKWEEALEEMELRYNTPLYHHPILLRKMAICAYNLWKKAFEKLPETYFEEGETNDQYDLSIIQYEKYLRAATKFLAEAHRTYLRDSEILEIYFQFLKKIKDSEKRKDVISKSLEAFNKDPEYYLLFTLMRNNKKDRYFNNEDYIIHLYEFDPFLDQKVKRLRNYCKSIARQLKTMSEDDDSTLSQKEKSKLPKLAIRIFRLFVTRVEHGNIELWFCRIVLKICTFAMSQEIEDVYFYYNVDDLLRKTNTLQHPDVEQIIGCADSLKEIVADFILKYGRKSIDYVAKSNDGENDDVEELKAEKDDRIIENDEKSLVNDSPSIISINDDESDNDPSSDLEEEEAAGSGSPFLEKESFYVENGLSTTDEEAEDSDEKEEDKDDDNEELLQRDNNEVKKHEQFEEFEEHEVHRPVKRKCLHDDDEKKDDIKKVQSTEEESSDEDNEEDGKFTTGQSIKEEYFSREEDEVEKKNTKIRQSINQHIVESKDSESTENSGEDKIDNEDSDELDAEKSQQSSEQESSSSEQESSSSESEDGNDEEVKVHRTNKKKCTFFKDSDGDDKVVKENGANQSSEEESDSNTEDDNDDHDDDE